MSCRNQENEKEELNQSLNSLSSEVEIELTTIKRSKDRMKDHVDPPPLLLGHQSWKLKRRRPTEVASVGFNWSSKTRQSLEQTKKRGLLDHFQGRTRTRKQTYGQEKNKE